MNSTLRQWMYGTLAAAGAAATWYYNVRFMAAGGWRFDLTAFVAGGFANDAAGSLAADVIVAAVVFLLWIRPEARRLGMRFWWLYGVLTVTVAFAFAFPFFLCMRERRLSGLDAPDRRPDAARPVREG